MNSILHYFYFKEQLSDASDSHGDFNTLGTVEDYLMQKRLRFLDNLVENTTCGRQKCALEKEFCIFLWETGSDRKLSSAMPYDVRRFLV